ncbi:PPC domain-containing protein [Aliikangiella sp. IMCC44359]|uniref:PPC domain-containing protein n=1 Tax=Aliikangiella sp. IMCC44359 TaxID=3459125 RepID=UPI00403AC783
MKNLITLVILLLTAIISISVESENSYKDDISITQAKKHPQNSKSTTSSCGSSACIKTPLTAPIELENGSAENLSASKGEELIYVYNAPFYTVDAYFSIHYGTGDADLYVSYETIPTDTSYDCRPYKDGNQERCVFYNKEGKYYIRVKASSSFSGVNLYATITDGSGPPPDGQILYEESVNVKYLASNSWKYFKLKADPSIDRFDIITSGGEGDVDLYVRYNEEVSASQFDCRPYKEGNDEICTFTNQSQEGDFYYIGVYGYRTSRNFTLKATTYP